MNSLGIHLTKTILLLISIYVGISYFSNVSYAQAGCANGGGQFFCWNEIGASDTYPNTVSERCEAQGGGSYGHLLPSASQCDWCSGSGACYWIDWHDPAPGCEPWTCSHGASSSNRNIIGRIYDTYTGPSRFWQPDDGGGVNGNCNNYDPIDNTGTTSVTNSSGGSNAWDCNETSPGSGDWRSLYDSVAASSGEGPHTFTLTPPPGFECDSWSISYPDTGNDPASGTGCNASVNLYSDQNWGNQLQWKIKPGPTQPTNLTVTPSCTASGASATFSWDPGPNYQAGDSYVLRINYDNGQDGDSGDSYEWLNNVGDWWLYVPSSVNANAVGTCSLAGCSTTLPIDYTGPIANGKPGVIESGNYINWSVTPRDSSGTEVPSLSAVSTGLNVPSCAATISGAIKQDTCDVGATTLTGAVRPDPSPVFDSTYATPGWSADGSYSLANIPLGTTGALCAEYQRTVGLSQFTLTCINGDTNVVAGYPCTNSLGVISSDLTDINIGYTETILQPKAWFSAYNGDVYGRSVTAEIPDNPQNPFKPYIGATTGLNNDSTVFGQIAVNSSEISENGKYADNFPSNTELINANNINFNPPTDAVELDGSDNLNNLDPSNTYVVGVNDLLDIMSPTYSLSSDGVAVIYVLANEQDPDEPLVFDTTFTSSNSARRILFISQAPIQISPSVVSAIADPNIAVIQAGLISNKDIVFETSQPALDDREVIVEGPIIAINGADATVDLKRDLGATNNLYLPSTTVLYNSIYLTQVPKDTGIEITDVTWRIIE